MLQLLFKCSGLNFDEWKNGHETVIKRFLGIYCIGHVIYSILVEYEHVLVYWWITCENQRVWNFTMTMVLKKGYVVVSILGNLFCKPLRMISMFSLQNDVLHVGCYLKKKLSNYIIQYCNPGLKNPKRTIVKL